MSNLVFDVELGLGHMLVTCPECDTESSVISGLTLIMSGLRCNACEFMNREDDRVLFT